MMLPLLLSPGPANLASAAMTARFGFPKTLTFIFGIVLVYWLVAIGLGVMTNQVFEQYPYVSRILKFLGGLFIIYLGTQLIWRKNSNVSITTPSFLKGALLQLLNPKYPPVVISIFAHNQNQNMLLTASTIAIIGAFGLALYAGLGVIIHRRINSDLWQRVIDLIFGVSLIIVGLCLLA